MTFHLMTLQTLDISYTRGYGVMDRALAFDVSWPGSNPECRVVLFFLFHLCRAIERIVFSSCAIYCRM